MVKERVIQEMKDATFKRALANFAGGFISNEEKAEPIHESYTTINNSSLRNNPNDASLTTVTQSIKVPQNVPNLTVPY